jgi:hypothetical protein
MTLTIAYHHSNIASLAALRELDLEDYLDRSYCWRPQRTSVLAWGIGSDWFYPSLSESVSNCIVRCTLSFPEDSSSSSMISV